MTTLAHQARRGPAAHELRRPLTPSVHTGAAVAGVGVSFPDTIVPSEEIGERLGVGPGWIERRTGIRRRRVAGPHERLDALAANAGRHALARAGLEPNDLDLVIVATTTPDEMMPGAAPLVAHALGAERAGAFDVSSACTGFLSALAVGSAQIETGRAGCVLVVGADLMSRVLDPDDRATAAVFADGAGAAVMVATEGESQIGPIVLGADGAGAPYIRVPRDDYRIRMRGHETFREAVARLSLATMQAATAAGTGLDQIDAFVYHQANARILAAIAERLELPSDRVIDCIGEYGNTSAATLPVALWHAEQDGRLADGSRVLLGAFGAGFTWGATVLDWGVPA